VARAARLHDGHALLKRWIGIGATAVLLMTLFLA
jgi:hypothetical protein